MHTDNVGRFPSVHSVVFFAIYTPMRCVIRNLSGLRWDAAHVIGFRKLLRSGDFIERMLYQTFTI